MNRVANRLLIWLVCATGLVSLLGSGVAAASRAMGVAGMPTTTTLQLGEVLDVSCPGQLAVFPSSAGSVSVVCGEVSAAPTATTVPTVAPSPTAVPATPAPTAVPTSGPVISVPKPSGVWLSAAEVAALPMNGAGWDAVKKAATGSWGSPNLADLNSTHDVYVLAGALYAVRTGDAAMVAKVRSAILSAKGSESGSRSLEVSRNIVSYVAAADLVGGVGKDEAAFRSWLSGLRTTSFDGRTIISTHEERPNNWGTMAGAARVAIDVYLGDRADLDRAWSVFRGWAGDRGSYAGFKYGDTSWQCFPASPVGINPAGCAVSGHDVGGVLPDDQRRGGSFRWPPPCEGYVHEGLQGALVQAQILERAGYGAFAASNRALERAYVWLTTQGCNASGDDSTYPLIANRAYGRSFPVGSGGDVGKNIGWLRWTHST